jgi:hypothetical protein
MMCKLSGMSDEMQVEEENSEVSDSDRQRLLLFLDELKTVHSIKLKKFAQNQIFTDNLLSRIRRNAPVRQNIFDEVLRRAEELELSFPDRGKRKPLEQQIMDGLGIEPRTFKQMAERWAGKYQLFTRLPRSENPPQRMVGIAELTIAYAPNGYGLPYFRLWRREQDKEKPLFIRGYWYEMEAGLYLIGHSDEPALPRLIALQKIGMEEQSYLAGTILTSTPGLLSYAASCAAIRLTHDSEVSLPFGSHAIEEVESHFPVIFAHLADDTIIENRRSARSAI